MRTARRRVRRVRVSCTCALGDQSFAATRRLARAGTRRTMAEALFYGFGINERASSPRRPRHSAKPHHRHQTRSAAAAAVGAAGSFTHGNRVNKASAHAIHRGRTQPASDATHGRRPTCVCRTHTHTHTHTRNRHTELNSFIRRLVFSYLASNVAVADALSSATHVLSRYTKGRATIITSRIRRRLAF